MDVIISSAISVRSVATVNSKFKDFNDKLAQLTNTMRLFACKTVIDAFFNNIRWWVTHQGLLPLALGPVENSILH